MMTRLEIMRGTTYARGVQSPAKKIYAQSVLAWMLRHTNRHPERSAELSYMAAQAVEMRLRELLPNGRPLDH